jgi:hypothetical protein
MSPKTRNLKASNGEEPIKGKSRKNIHLVHIEDTIFESTFLPLEVFQDVYDYLTGQKTLTSISVKWDGAPAFVCGIHPETKKFFLGTKSVFSGKVNCNHNDIEINHPESAGLRTKLHTLMRYLSPLEWSGIYQGDLLWIGLEGYCLNHKMSFRPNTLHYLMDVKDKMPSLGAVLHTTYLGETMESLEAYPGAVVPKHRHVEDLFLFEPSLKGLPFEGFDYPKFHKFQDDFQPAYVRASQYAMEVHSTCQSILEELRRPYVNQILNKYLNHCVLNEMCANSTNFLFYLEDQFDAHIKLLKTEKGKAKLLKEKQITLCKICTPDLITLFYYRSLLVNLKMCLVDRLNIESQDGVEISLPNGTQCGHEGFVVSSRGRIYKFVDRDCFSKANFTAVKEWQGK